MDGPHGLAEWNLKEFGATTTHDLNDCETEGGWVLSNPVAFVVV